MSALRSAVRWRRRANPADPGPLGPAYQRVLLASVISTFGDGVRFAALPLLAADLLADPLRIAVVTAATTLPWLVLGLPVGAYVDRVSRVQVMIGADLLRGFSLVGAIVLLATDQLGFGWLVLLALMLGTGEVLFDCAAFAVLPNIVARARLETANARLLGAQSIARDLLGHLAGGALYGASRTLPLLTDAVSFLVSAATLRRLRSTTRSPPASAPKNLLLEARRGLRTVFTGRLQVVLTTVGALSSSVYLGQIATLVLFVKHDLRAGPMGYVAILAIGAVGGLLAGALADRLAARLGRAITLIASVVLMAGAGLGVLASTLPTTILGYLSMCFGIVSWNTVAVSLRQSLVPDEMLGCTMGAYRLVVCGSMPLGALVFGAGAQEWGAHAVLSAGGVCLLAVAIVITPVLSSVPSLRRHPVAQAKI